MGKDIIRLLNADEIECRVDLVSERGVRLVLYKDARVDQKILDETFGPFGWQRSHQSIDGNLYCTVEIYDKEKECWISKQDVGTTGYTEKEKTQASDSFKRACFNWGIGRELYTAPFIWIPAGKTDIRNIEGRFVCDDHFSVRMIAFNKERQIVKLCIVNRKGQNVFELDAGSKPQEPKAAEPKSKSDVVIISKPAVSKGKDAITEEQAGALLAELERTGVRIESVRERYGIGQLEEMTQAVYAKAMEALAKTKTKEVA